MNIEDHGAWSVYTPATPPANAPISALFARRSDGADWYDYVNSGSNFAADTIKMTIRYNNVVGAAVFDPTMLWPEASTVLEVSGVTTDDPQAMFGGKIYDPATQTFSDAQLPPIIPEGLTGPTLADLEARIAALEAKQGGP